MDPNGKTILLIVAAILASPVSFSRDLHSLRYASYLGLLSVALLIIFIAKRSVDRNAEFPDLFSFAAVEFTDSFFNAMTSFPIFCVSFMCHFNIVSVTNKLSHPSTGRIRALCGGSMFIALLAYMSMGLFGYFYDYSNIKDNIFNNFPVDDPLINVGRFGFVITLVCALPLMVVPGREALLLLFDSISNGCQPPDAYQPVPDEESRVNAKPGLHK